MSQAQRPPVPPVLYVPCEDTTQGGDVTLSLRRTKDGRTALLAYTALDRLVTCCGPHQPWALVQTERLEELGAQQPYDVIYLDLLVPEEQRVPGGVR